MNTLDIAIKDLEQAYSSAYSKVVYAECLASPTPIETALTRYSYCVVGHKDIKTDGIVTGREIVDDKVRQIDLLKLCEFANQQEKGRFNIDWQYYIERFNQLLCLRSATELKFTPAQIKEIASTYYMNKLTKDIDLGKTPTSNNQICKQLQTIVDKIIFKDDGKGCNTLKVNNHDIAYILMVYAKKSRNALTVQVSKHDFMRRLVYDVIYRLLTNKTYNLEYKAIKK